MNSIPQRSLFNRVLLVNPKRESEPLSILIPPVEPLELSYTAGAFLGLATVTIVDLQLGFGDFEEALREFSLGRYDLVGIALPQQSFLRDARVVAQRLKTLRCVTPVCVFGQFASLNALWLLEQEPNIDFPVIDAPDVLVRTLLERGPQAYATTVRSRLQARAEGSPNVQHALSLPAAPADRSLTAAVIEKGGAPALLGSVGCGAACTFCSTALACGSGWVPRAVDEVCAEVRGLVGRFGPHRLNFMDTNLLGHIEGARPWAKRLSEALAGFQPALALKTSTRLDDLDAESVALLRAAGFTALKLGLETLCEESQRAYQKLISQEFAAEKVALVRSAGLGVSLQFIMFGPYTTLAGLEQNLDFLLQYPDCWGRNVFGSKLCAYRGTRIEQQLEANGLAVSRGIFGTEWRFREAEVEAVQRRLMLLLEAELLGTERLLRRVPYTASASHRQAFDEVEALLKRCWLGLFRHALSGRAPDTTCRRALGEARLLVQEFCSHFP